MYHLIRRAVAVAALPLLFLLATGLAGLNFGAYWDDEAMFTKVRRAMASPPTLLPDAYDYPSVTFWLSLAGITPEARRDPKLRYRIPDTAELVAFTTTDTYRLRVRAIFLSVSSLAIVWTAGLSLATGAKRWEALLAAAIAAASWELQYHLRWIAPDGITMMSATAAVFAATVAVQATPTAVANGWCAAAATAFGLATGTKYSAWPLALPLAIAAWQTAPRPTSAWRRARRTGAFLLASVLVYLVTTPGSLLQPTLFVGAIRGQLAHYATGHDIYTIDAGAIHLWRILQYAGAVLLSPYLVIALAWAAAALAGAYALARSSPRVAVVTLIFPICYVLYLALQRVMIVRNIILLAPFTAVLAARGVRWAWDASEGHRRAIGRRSLLATGVALALVLSAAFDIAAANSIRRRGNALTVREFAAWADAQPSGSVRMSARIRTALEAAGLHHGSDGGSSAATAEPRYVAFYALEPAHLQLRPNEPRLFQAVFGPREVNLNYYPDWIGDEHIVVLSGVQAARFKIAVQ